MTQVEGDLAQALRYAFPGRLQEGFLQGPELHKPHEPGLVSTRFERLDFARREKPPGDIGRISKPSEHFDIDPDREASRDTRGHQPPSMRQVEEERRPAVLRQMMRRCELWFSPRFQFELPLDWSDGLVPGKASPKKIVGNRVVPPIASEAKPGIVRPLRVRQDLKRRLNVGGFQRFGDPIANVDLRCVEPLPASLERHWMQAAGWRQTASSDRRPCPSA